MVAGFGSLSAFRERAAYATTVEDSVYVDAAWRGRGVGRALLEELVTLARTRGFHTVIARASGDNAPSIALHQACGFTWWASNARWAASSDGGSTSPSSSGCCDSGPQVVERRERGRSGPGPPATTAPSGEQALAVEG